MNIEEIKQDVWKTVQEMNRAWAVEHECSKLKDYFHQDMVAIVPLMRERLEGQSACIEGWDSFVKSAEIHEWKEIDPKVQIYAGGKCAVVTYYYDMSVTMGGMNMRLTGRDMMTLINEDGRWFLIADQFSSAP